jgi:hypothetical protein
VTGNEEHRPTYWVEFATFAHLFSHRDGRRIVLQRLRKWYGVQFDSLAAPVTYIMSDGREVDDSALDFRVLDDQGLRVRVPGVGILDLPDLHRRIGSDPEQRESLYQAYMDLAHAGFYDHDYE